MLKIVYSYLFTMVYSIPYKCVEQKDITIQGENYWTGTNCNIGGTHSVNEFGANICEYPGDKCPIVKYFSYSDGGGGVELCCSSNSDCNYDPIKNYCHPEFKRCVDSTYFNCASEKGGPLFASCL